MSRVFWDTNLFIYLIEAKNPFDLKVKQVLSIMNNQEYELLTSALTVCEALVMPTRKANTELIASYKFLFSQMDILSLQMDVSDHFAQLRANTSIKTPDALQIACAMQANIPIFITNDERLTQYSSQEITIYSLDGFLMAYA